MQASATKRKFAYSDNRDLSKKVQPEKPNLGEIVESLAKALNTLESLKQVEKFQVLKLYTRHFPKNGVDFYEVTKLYERSLIEQALKESNGNQTEAAKLLNLGLSTLNAKIKKHGISTKTL